MLVDFLWEESMESFIPELFYGNYKDVMKKFRAAKTRSKSLAKIKEFYKSLNDDIATENLHGNYRICLSDGYISEHILNESFFPYLFSKYILDIDDPDFEIRKWYKEKAIENKWCQLSILATYDSNQILYEDKEYNYRLLESINENWNFYASMEESFCFMTWLELMEEYKKDNKYYFWENNLGLYKLIYNITGEKFDRNELKDFPKMWKKLKESYGAYL